MAGVFQRTAVFIQNLLTPYFKVIFVFNNEMYMTKSQNLHLSKNIPHFSAYFRLGE
jgi:hypothetical protein